MLYEAICLQFRQEILMGYSLFHPSLGHSGEVGEILEELGIGIERKYDGGFLALGIGDVLGIADGSVHIVLLDG
jgi:hypothetical protein